MTTLIEVAHNLRPSGSSLASLGIGVPVSTILVWIAGLNGIVVPGEVQAALGAVVAALSGYFFTGGKHNDTQSGFTQPPS